MQKDFHFYSVYAISRAAGLNSTHAHTIAYASQHTDDAQYGHTLEFENGGRFTQVMTAHEYLSLSALTKESCYSIWIPFHFLPANQGVTFYERMITRSDNIIFASLLDDFFSAPLKPQTLHRLGILLHVAADMYSHQGFIGVIHKQLNDVKKLKLNNSSKDQLKPDSKKLKASIAEYCMPKLGHAQALTVPDEPYWRWSYENGQGEKSGDIYNVTRSMRAVQFCYQILIRFLKQFPEFRESNRSEVPWHKIAAKISNIFQSELNLKGRIQIWKDAIYAEEFGFSSNMFDKLVEYDDREWFRDAVIVSKNEDDTEKYTRRDYFEMSHWKYFHDAASLHRHIVLKEILPVHGIICG